MEKACQLCYLIKDEKYMLMTQCGYMICYNHFKMLPENFICIKCNNHIIEKNICLNTKNNRKKIMQINLENELFQLKMNEIKMIKNDPKYFLNEIISDLINKIDLRREQLHMEITKKLDQEFDKLYAASNNIKTRFENNLINNLNEIDITQIEKISEADLENLKTIENNKFKPVFDLLDEIKTVDFKIGDFQFKIDNEDKIGKIVFSHKDTSTRKESESNDLSKIPSEIFDASSLEDNNIRQLKNDEIIGISSSNPCKLVKWDPESNKIIELDGHKSDIFFVDIDENDTILSISSDCVAKVWVNYVPVKSFQIKIKEYYSFKINKSNLVSYDTDNEITLREIETGKIIKMFQGHNSPVFCANYFSKSEYLTSHVDRCLKLWDLQTGKCLKTYKMNSSILCIEILNKINILTGSFDGRLNIVRKNSNKKGISQKISRNRIIFIKVINKSNFLTYDNEYIKFWNYSNEVLRKLSQLKKPNLSSMEILYIKMKISSNCKIF